MHICRVLYDVLIYIYIYVYFVMYGISIFIFSNIYHFFVSQICNIFSSSFLETHNA
jgi:hypothetical protein